MPDPISPHPTTPTVLIGIRAPVDIAARGPRPIEPVRPRRDRRSLIGRWVTFDDGGDALAATDARRLQDRK
jgi:hypothetical protein